MRYKNALKITTGTYTRVKYCQVTGMTRSFFGAKKKKLNSKHEGRAKITKLTLN